MSKNKKFIIGIFIGLIVAGGLTTLAAPVGTVLRSFIPEEDNKYYGGTTTPKTYWANVYTRILTVSSGTATTTISAGDTFATFAYPFTGITSTLNATTSGLRMASSSVLGVLNVGTLNATTTINAPGGMTLTCSSCLTDANVSDTLTASDLIAGSSVVANAEVDNDLTISGGVIDNSVIGGTTAAAGTFTTLTANLATTLSTSTIQGYLNVGVLVATTSARLDDLTVTGTATFPASSISSLALNDGGIIGFEWIDAEVSNTLTASDLIAGSEVVADSEVVDGLTISGGTVNNSIIGATTAAAGTFTNLTATASSTIARLWAGSSATTSRLFVSGNFAAALASTTGATSQLIDWNNGPTQRIILQGNTNIILNSTSSNPIDGGRYVLKIVQDSTGSRTVAWSAAPSPLWWNGTTTIASTANQCTWLGMIYESRSLRYTVVASSTPLTAYNCQ